MEDLLLELLEEELPCEQLIAAPLVAVPVVTTWDRIFSNTLFNGGYFI
jgi:hypothetical protein